jgi:TRAP-type mannitol/chloroaromatic compound transport system permease large subunit
MIGMIMFGVALLMLMLGFPVAFTFGGVALFFGIFAEGMDLFAFMPYRIMSVMQNTVLMAVPLFIFMGVVLQRTRLAEQLLTSMGRLFGGLPGGLAISTILVGCTAGRLYRCCRRQRGCHGSDLAAGHAGA